MNTLQILEVGTRSVHRYTTLQSTSTDLSTPVFQDVFSEHDSSTSCCRKSRIRNLRESPSNERCPSQILRRCYCWTRWSLHRLTLDSSHLHQRLFEIEFLLANNRYHVETCPSISQRLCGWECACPSRSHYSCVVLLRHQSHTDVHSSRTAALSGHLREAMRMVRKTDCKRRS